ncbi:MAG: hypothetical protein AAGB32_03845 [Pseudomonadota bacterium]
MKLLSAFLVLITFPLVSACQSSGPSAAEQKIQAYDARIKAFEEQGTVVKQTTYKAGEPIDPSTLTLEEAESRAKIQCLAENSNAGYCDHIKASYNEDGTISYKVKR